MNIERIAVLIASTVLVGLQAQTPLQEFTEKAKSQGATPGEIISFLRSHQHDHSLYRSIGITFKIWHDESYDKGLWRQIAGQFFDFALFCQQSKSNPDDKRWMDFLGDPFKELYDFIADKHGIHGNVSVNVDTEKSQLELKVYHDDSYDEEAWLRILDIFIAHIEQINPDDANDDTWMQSLGSLLRSVIDASGNVSGIHGLLEAKLDDTTNCAGIGYTA